MCHDKYHVMNCRSGESFVRTENTFLHLLHESDGHWSLDRWIPFYVNEFYDVNPELKEDYNLKFYLIYDAVPAVIHYSHMASCFNFSRHADDIALLSIHLVILLQRMCTVN